MAASDEATLPEGARQSKDTLSTSVVLLEHRSKDAVQMTKNDQALCLLLTCEAAAACSVQL